MRYLPNTDVRLWDPNDPEMIHGEAWMFPEDLPEGTLITAFVEVMDMLKQARLTNKAKQAYKEFALQMELEEVQND